MATFAAVLGRILLGAYFIVTGMIMVLAPAPFDAMLRGAGFQPGVAVPFGVVEALAGLCLAAGAMTRLVALLLAAWMAVMVVVLHPAEISAAQVPDILLQVALIGGLLLVFAHSQVWWSWDAMRRDRLRARAALDAEQRAHDADVRAARAEGAAEATGNPAVVRRRWF